MRRRALFTLIVVSIFLSSCPTKVVELEKWPFESRGIKIRYRADERLNYYEGQAHTLFVCMYQLADPNAFNDLRMDVSGVQKLLECKRFDESVSSSDQLIIHPGEEETVIYDRAEDARFVGLVAGYYHLWPEHTTKLLLVPVRIEESGRIFKKRTAVPAPLKVHLLFGPEEIQQILE